MKSYILSIDQSTQGTKAMLVDENGAFLLRRDIPHRQLVSPEGWVGHDATEIADNIFRVCEKVLHDSGIDPAAVIAVAVTNQRESVAVWDRKTGDPVCESIVWQCNRAAELCERLADSRTPALIREKTGLNYSPFFSAPKVAWILENIPGVRERAERGELCLGTMDSWTIWQLTDGRSHFTDTSNANRTMLYNIQTGTWDESLCRFFGIPESMLPDVLDSDALFGKTDLRGLLPHEVPIHAAVGDSNAIVVSHGCIRQGDALCGYGTGSAVIVNVGHKPINVTNGANMTTLYSSQGRAVFGMEGVINYSGAVVTWLTKNAGLAENAAQTSAMAFAANPQDKTYMVPAFTGIGAPHWKPNATAAYVGMTRLTGQNELVRAALESVAYQIADLVLPAGERLGVPARELRVAGGPSRNAYLMQFQSDILGCPVVVPEYEELSGIGSAYLAGMAMGLFDLETVLKQQKTTVFQPKMSEEERQERLLGWKHALDVVFQY